MKRTLLYLGIALAAGSAPLAATAQATPHVPPLTINAGSHDGFIDDCVKWNANEPDGSNSKWGSGTQSSIWGSDTYVFKFSYQNDYEQTNDWMFLPDIQFEAAQYDISFEYCKQSSGWEEIFAMTLAQGKNVDAHTAANAITVATLHDEFAATMKSYTTRISIPTAGVYNIGLQSTSPRNQYNFYIANIRIEKVDPAAPETGILTASTDGLDATVTVTFPTKVVSGNDIPAGTQMSAVISIDKKDMSQTVTGTPGSSASATFSFDKSQTVTATCMVSYTDADGLHASAKSVSDEIEVRKKKLEVLPDGYTLWPDNDERDWATFVDANGDHNTFEFIGGSTGRHIPGGFDESDSKGVWCYEYSETTGADDWIITPAWAGPTTGAIKLSYGLATAKNMFADYDVCVAATDDLDALKANVVYSETEVCTDNYCAYREVYFEVTPNTQYFLAFHLKSPLQSNTTTNWYTDFFSIHCESADGTIPAAAVLSDATKDKSHAGLSFTVTLPTKDVVGNDLPAEPIHADIYMTDATAPEHLTGMPGTSFEKVYTNLQIGKFYEFRVHTYRLEGEEKVGDSMVSTGSIQIEIDDTYTAEAPVTFNLGTQGIFEMFTVINANEDDKIFTCSPGNGANIGYNQQLPMDDWMISKGIVIEDVDQLYEFFLSFKSGSSRYVETCELYWSTGLSDEAKTRIDAIKAQIDALDPNAEDYRTQKAALDTELNKALAEEWPAAMTNRMISETEPRGTLTTYIANPVRFDAPCTIYIGIHGCSAKDQMTLLVQDAGIRLHETGADDPDAVTGLAAEGKVSGALMADVTFTMPATTVGAQGSEDINGDDVVDENDWVTSPLNPDLDLVAVVKSAVETKTVTGKPGQEVSVEIAAAEGVSEITVFVQSPEYSYIPEGVNPDTNGDGVVDDNDDNVAVTVPAGQSPKSTVEVFCGVHQPKAPVVSGQPVLAEDNLGFTIAWEAVTECANEGETHLNPEGLVYRVYETIRGAEEPQLVAETAELNATVRLADDADKTMAMHIYTVKAFNGLESEESDAFAAIFGQPESLPMEDNFADGYAQGMFLVYGMGDYVDPATAGAPATESNVVLSLEPDQDLYVELPKFSTDGVDKGYVEFTFHADATTAPVTVTIEANGDAEPTVLGTLEAAEGDDGWKSVHFDYPAAMLGKKAVSVKCNTSIGAGQKFLLDSYIATNYEYVGLDNVSALAGASARGLEGAILLQGFAGHEVAVCTPDGRVVATVNADDDAVTVPATTGIYVVAADGFAAKVAVK